MFSVEACIAIEAVMQNCLSGQTAILEARIDLGLSWQLRRRKLIVADEGDLPIGVVVPRPISRGNTMWNAWKDNTQKDELGNLRKDNIM